MPIIRNIFISSLITFTLSISLNVKAADTHTMTNGTFQFYDASGAESVLDAHSDVQGTFDMVNGTGGLTTSTPFTAALWTADIAETTQWGATSPVENHSFTWTMKRYLNGTTFSTATCNISGNLDGCAAYEASPLWSQIGIETNSYDYTLSEGQFAFGIFFDWSINTDITVLSVFQIDNVDTNGVMTVSAVDSDNDGAPGTAMWWKYATQADVDADFTGETVLGAVIGCTGCGPFPKQTPVFSGTIAPVSPANLAPTAAIATTPSINDNATYTVSLTDVNVAANTGFPANLFNPDVTIQAQTGTGYTLNGNIVTPTVEPAISTTITVPVTVTDSRFGESAAVDLIITVTADPDAPVITNTTPATGAAVGSEYSYDAAAIDPDGDGVTYSLTLSGGGTAADLPAWLSFTGSTLVGTPLLADDGSTVQNITITATDDSGSALEDSVGPFTITVVNTNSAPTITGTPDASVDQDVGYVFNPTVDDPDKAGGNETLTVTFSGLPGWITQQNSTSGRISGTPGNADVGTTSNIIITVTDAIGATASLPAFSITVNNVNDAPTISGTPATLVNEGVLYSFTPDVNDIDANPADTLSFSITNQPTWAGFDPISGMLDGTPTAADAGTTSNIVITVSDDGTPVLSNSLAAFSITVNSKPQASNGLFSTAVDTTINDNLTASDPDGDNITYNLIDNATYGMASIDMNDGSFSYVPNAGFEGQDSFTYKVNDGNMDSDLAKVTLYVGTSTTFRYEGSNFTMLNSDGTNANGGANDVAATWNGVTTTDIADTNFSNMTIASTTPFFGALWDAHHIRVFSEGTYTFDTTCTVVQIEAGITDCNNPLQGPPAVQTEQYMTMTVGPGQIGAYMLFNWSGNNNIDVVNVYDINAVFTTDVAGGLYTQGGYGPYPWSGAPDPATTKWRLASTDSDGDGIAGVPMVDGAFIGSNANFNLLVGSGETKEVKPEPNSVQGTKIDSFIGSVSLSILAGLSGMILLVRRKLAINR